MKLDPLLLFSGNDIPFISCGVTIHHPTIKEIAYLGEDTFFTGYQMLLISKNILSQEDKVNLETLTNFDILIAILKERNAVMQKNRNCIQMVLMLLFPEYEVILKKDVIILKKENEEEHFLNSNNFEEFQNILRQMFSFGDTSGVPQDFNPDGPMAARIAEKLKKRHQTLAEKNSNDNFDIIGRYISVLSIGLSIDIKTFMDYTIYQLFDQIKRYELKIGYDLYVQGQLAGVKDAKEPEDWMKSIHSDN